MTKGWFGAAMCGMAIPLVIAGCSSNVRKPPPRPAPSTATAQRPLPPHAPPPAQGAYGSAERIVSVARRELAMWYQPFIDSHGRLASYRVSEAEQSLLADGTEAWQRVLGYWRDSGTLYEMVRNNIAGAYSCQFPSGFAQGKAECRTFLVDNPWSAAFVSYVMLQARVPGFRASPRHFDYIRQAYHTEAGGPYLYTDPATQRPDPGDLLCYVRGNGSVLGYEGLTAWLGSGSGGSLNSHCDIVVARDRELQTIGGNVLNGVTLRKLKLDPQGRAVLPRPVGVGYASDGSADMGIGCNPSNEAACDFNRQNWAVLLKLKPMFAYPTRATGVPTMLRPSPGNPPQPVTAPTMAPQPATPAPIPQPVPAPPQPPLPQPTAPQPTVPQSSPPQPAPPTAPPSTQPPLPPAPAH
jgi:hypothetical protein